MQYKSELRWRIVLLICIGLFIVVSRAGAGLDVRDVRSSANFWTKPEKEKIDAAERFETFDIAGQFAFEIFGVGAHRIEALYFAKEVRAE